MDTTRKNAKLLSIFVRSDRSSYGDDVLLYIWRKQQLFSDFHSVHWYNWCYMCLSKSLLKVSMHLISQDADWCRLNVKWSNVQMLKSSNVPMFKYCNVPMFKCSNVQVMFKCSCAQCSNIQKFKCLNVQKFKCSNVEMLKYSNVQMFKCSKVQIFKC